MTWLAVLPFAHMGLAHIWAIAYFGAGAALILGFLGVMAGLWAEKFDQMAAVTNFVVMPMTFLSGTFYLIERLPEPFRTFSKVNPFFYLIDGFRYGFIGHAEGSLAIGAGAEFRERIVDGGGERLVQRHRRGGRRGRRSGSGPSVCGGGYPNNGAARMIADRSAAIFITRRQRARVSPV